MTGRTGLRWAIYPRISGKQGATSGDADDETVSMDTQEAECRAMIARIDPTGIVADGLVFREIHTGVELFTRPKLTQLREAVRRGEVDAIACYQPKRWARDPDHAGYLKTELREHGVMLRFVLDDHGDGDAADVMGYLEHWTGKKEHKDITERTHRARTKLVHLGQPWVGCKAPYGLRWRYQTIRHATGRVEQRKAGWNADPVEAAVVAWLFARFVDLGDAASLRRLEGELRERGIPSPMGKPGWTHATIKQVLTSRLYVGDAYGLTRRQDTADAYVGRTGKSAGRHKYRVKVVPEEDWVPLPSGYAPRLVEQHTFDAVQAKLGRLRPGGRRAVEPDLCIMRGGRARCAACGRALVIRRRPLRAAPDRPGKPGPKPRDVPRVQLVCNGRQKWNACPSPAVIEGRILDDAAVQLARTIYERPEILAEQAALHRESDPTRADLAMVEQTLAEIEQQQTSIALVAAQVTSAAAAAPLAAQLERLAGRAEQAVQDRAELLARRAGWDAERRFFEQFEAAAGGIQEELATFSAEEWQRAIDALGIVAVVRRAGRTADDRYELQTRLTGVLTLEMLRRLGLPADGRSPHVMDSTGSSAIHETPLILTWTAAQLRALAAS